MRKLQPSARHTSQTFDPYPAPQVLRTEQFFTLVRCFCGGGLRHGGFPMPTLLYPVPTLPSSDAHFAHTHITQS